ncbi:TPA: hypothetical protein DCZ31_03610 [Patescibacteria group bacterium]|nr:hypothetical protein [Candidatus Gracilibacteria bacterium]
MKFFISVARNFSFGGICVIFHSNSTIILSESFLNLHISSFSIVSFVKTDCKYNKSQISSSFLIKSFFI